MPVSGPYRIRQGIAADLEAIIALWQASPGIVLRSDDEPDRIVRFLTEARGRCWLAEAGDEVVGAVLVGQDGRRGYFYHLAVASQWQRIGIGWALVDAALEDLASLGITRSHVLVLADNATARAFWERLGWTERRELALYSYTGGTADED